MPKWMKGILLYHKDLEAYKIALEFVVDIYQITKTFPEYEQFGLSSQMRRCAISIPSNIAEGCARQSDKESYRFINIAIGSVAELETQLIIAQRLGYIQDIEYMLVKIKKINALVIGLKRFFDKTTC